MTVSYSFPLTSFVGTVNVSSLAVEIQQSTISIALDSINQQGESVDLLFKADLQTQDYSSLLQVIGAHTGAGIDTSPRTLAGVPLVAIEGAKENDQKLVVVSSPAHEGWMTLFVGAGDDPSPTPPATGRGTGQRIRITLAGAGDQSVELQFNEPIELHDGGVWTTGEFTIDDSFDLSVTIPATPLTPNEGAGNCNLVDIPGTGGAAHIIVPAPGLDGSHDVVLSSAALVPAMDKDGFWDADYDDAIPRVSTRQGQADWHLMDVPLTSYFLRAFPLGHPAKVYDFDVYKAEWIPTKWKLNVTVHKVSAGAAELVGWLMTFRKYST